MRASVWLQLEVKGQYFWASLVGGISGAPRPPSGVTSDDGIGIAALGHATTECRKRARCVSRRGDADQRTVAADSEKSQVGRFSPPVMDRAPRLHADQADRRRAARIRARDTGWRQNKILCFVGAANCVCRSAS